MFLRVAARQAGAGWPGQRLAFGTAALPLVITGAGSASSWQVLVGWVVGFACGLLPGSAAAFVLAPAYVRGATALAGEQYPWRRRFLRFAADRSLLTTVDGEYRFVHLLVRDHLAECDPASLAEAVQRRRAELAADAPSAPSRV